MSGLSSHHDSSCAHLPAAECRAETRQGLWHLARSLLCLLGAAIHAAHAKISGVQRMKLINVGLASVAALTLISAALAQDDAVVPAAGADQAEQAQGEAASVSPVAADELAAQFKLLDIDEDNRLSAEEATGLDPIVAAMFGALDTDEDSYLSLEEFRKVPAEETHETAEE
jgi:hypothetical protein